MNQTTSETTSGYGIERCYHDYTGVPVLTDVSFRLGPGEVHGLVGENGSGKSTLIKILTGALSPRLGTITMDGEVVRLSTPKDAQALGLGVVYQDYHLFPELTVAQNIFGVNAPPPRRRWTRTMDRTAVERTVEGLLDELQIEIPSTKPVHALGPAERKFVEIASAMLLHPRFLILDEPTASLAPSAAHAVLDLLDRLREQGVGLAFVSHRLDEIIRISDQVTVLRDGKAITRMPTSETDEGKLADLITGGMAEKEAAHRRDRKPGGEIAVRVSNLRCGPGRPPLDFEVERGEIFGLTGLLGAGAETIVRMLGGATPLQGEIEVDGAGGKLRTPRHASKLGIGFIPEDRKGTGLIREQSIALNVSLPSLPSVSRAGVLQKDAIHQRAEGYREGLSIKASSVDVPVWTLSGGNQQKVMLAKWLASGARVLAIEEPTHGVDVGAKLQVHDLLRQYADAGGTVIVASTDVSEVLDLCDRIGVMRHGALSQIVSADELTKSAVTVLGTRDPEQMLEHLIESETVAAA
ncbi:MAG: sugar ABC transporter ATP-binding protein [Solirubrobacterales bacterium]|nr:sugar ABC transporter ATP-binding protein [Solirubrobacterales bacterium]